MIPAYHDPGDVIVVRYSKYVVSGEGMFLLACAIVGRIAVCLAGGSVGTTDPRVEPPASIPAPRSSLYSQALGNRHVKHHIMYRDSVMPRTCYYYDIGGGLGILCNVQSYHGHEELLFYTC